MNSNNRKNKKIVHIHTDLKFISDSNRFKCDIFENEIFIIGNSVNLKDLPSDNISVFKYSPASIRKIINRCIGADLIVFYGLDTIKARIIKKLPGKMLVAWRFFGYELYSLDNNLSFSEKTLQTFLKRKDRKVKSYIRIYSYMFKSFLLWGTFSETFYLSAIGRINFFLCHSKPEYDMLKSRWPDLPPFVRLPVSLKHRPVVNSKSKEKLIIVGNNRSSYNNNLDIIEIIESSEKRKDYSFLILFNYGPESNYSRKVREAVNNKDYFTLVNDFMTFGEFEELYTKASAAVFNGYRQMALGNIFAALKYGVKLYLNERNIIKEWLCSSGIKIYSIEDLEHDLREGTVGLNAEETRENAENFKEMLDSYTSEDFQNKLIELLEESF